MEKLVSDPGILNVMHTHKLKGTYSKTNYNKQIDNSHKKMKTNILSAFSCQNVNAFY